MGLCWSSPGGGGGGSFDGTLSGAAPALSFVDTDGDDGDTSASITVNLTATGTGAEDADVTFTAQQSGADVDWLQWDSSLDKIVTAGAIQVPNEAVVGNDVAGGTTRGIRCGNTTLGLKFNNFESVTFQSSTFNIHRVATLYPGDVVATPNWMRDSSETDNGIGHSASDNMTIYAEGPKFHVRKLNCESIPPFIFPSYDDSGRSGLSPAAGWTIFNTDDGELNIHDGTNWILASTGAST